MLLHIGLRMITQYNDKGAPITAAFCTSSEQAARVSAVTSWNALAHKRIVLAGGCPQNAQAAQGQKLRWDTWWHWCWWWVQRPGSAGWQQLYVHGRRRLQMWPPCNTVPCCYDCAMNSWSLLSRLQLSHEPKPGFVIPNQKDNQTFLHRLMMFFGAGWCSTLQWHQPPACGHCYAFFMMYLSAGGWLWGHGLQHQAQGWGTCGSTVLRRKRWPPTRATGGHQG